MATIHIYIITRHLISIKAINKLQKMIYYIFGLSNTKINCERIFNFVCYLYNYTTNDQMSSVKKNTMGQSSVIMGGLSKLENKENLNVDEIKEMIDLLKAQDFNSAQNVKNKIAHLKGQEVIFKKENIAVKQKQHIEGICKEGEQEIKRFQQVWDTEIQKLIQQLKMAEEELLRMQNKDLEQYRSQLNREQTPKIKYSSRVLEKRKYLTNLIKTRNYKEAEIVKNDLKQLQIQEQMRWNDKIEEKKKLKLEKMMKKQMSELQATRLKLEAYFNEKIKERDCKFEILLKKNRKRRIDSTKPTRQRTRSQYLLMAQSKLHPETSYM